MSDKKVYFVPKNSPVYPSVFDTRVRLRSLTLGLIKPGELEKHLEALPDESANADFIEFNAIINNEEAEGSRGDERDEPIGKTDSAFIAKPSTDSFRDNSYFDETPKVIEAANPPVISPTDSSDFD